MLLATLIHKIIKKNKKVLQRLKKHDEGKPIDTRHVEKKFKRREDKI